MQQSGCLDVIVETYQQGPQKPKPTFQLAAWYRSATRGIYSTLSGSSEDSMWLPGPHRSYPRSASATLPADSPSSQRPMFVTTCMHLTEHHVKISQPSLFNIRTDRQLFQLLSMQLKQCKRQYRGFMSMRRTRNIFFIKVGRFGDQVMFIPRWLIGCSSDTSPQEAV